MLCLSLVVLAMDNTILNVALPTLAQDLGATGSQLQWMVDAYLLVFAGLLLTMGALGDRFGRRRIFVIGVVWFASASLLCAVAPSIPALVAARAAPEEAVAFGRWLVSAAQAAADAAREGGFLGFRAAQVSEREEAMLERVRAAVAG